MEYAEIDILSVGGNREIDFITLPIRGSACAAVLQVVKSKHARVAVHTPPESGPSAADVFCFDIAAIADPFACRGLNRESRGGHAKARASGLRHSLGRIRGFAQSVGVFGIVLVDE